MRLLVPRSSGSSFDDAYSPLAGVCGTPMPSILEQQMLAPGESRTGWVSFEVPRPSGSLTATGADLDFYKVDFHPRYRGSIRLWK